MPEEDLFFMWLGQGSVSAGCELDERSQTDISDWTNSVH
jgi:hypothetical protein